MYVGAERHAHDLVDAERGHVVDRERLPHYPKVTTRRPSEAKDQRRVPE
jgi:hypothetical protein